MSHGYNFGTLEPAVDVSVVANLAIVASLVYLYTNDLTILD